ncbi:MAG: phospho-sugar mutase [Actinomycetota bacterium]
MSRIDDHLRRRVRAWLAHDPDPETRAELEQLLANDPDEVARRFADRIAFGTAGLRAAMGAGPTLMNELVVRQTTTGLMRWLEPGASVVVGHDARHRSHRFARAVVNEVVRCGGRAELIDGPRPTPVLAHAVLDRGADAGVMITASHNPPADNGYKLYLADGIQLVAPADREIAASIDQVAAAEEADPPAVVAAASAASASEAASVHPTVTILGPEMADRHLDAALAARVAPTTADGPTPRVLYTAMHGVGGEHVMQAFERAGLPTPAVVPQQFHPDPDFATVAFPNPEEAGALDLAFAAAEAESVDLVLANDPDADRLAAAVRDRDGAWVRLSGDQLGILLADHLLRHTATDAPRMVASSLVSSRLIDALAAEAGVDSIRTLTGFKWVARPIVDRPADTYVFGYEEALGYCVGDRVRDKDGISAAIVAVDAVAELMANGHTVWDHLDAIAARHGHYLTRPLSVRLDEGADDASTFDVGALLDQLVADSSPMAGVAIDAVDDLRTGAHLPPTAGVIWDLSDRSRVIVRPSGTEPKIKAYVEVIATDVTDGLLRLDQLVAAIAERLGARS